jgi:hypothetical protein
MEKPGTVKKELHRCVHCQKPLKNFIAYIPGEGESCLGCFTDYAQSKEVLATISPEAKK